MKLLRHILRNKMKATRAAHGIKLLNDLKPYGTRIIFYLDEKQ
uniref:Uncharacterized protein n=1 Tax=Lepeophtheirus salmonis TaxID=72036 RepID=A0A0K2TSK6_LEPSM